MGVTGPTSSQYVGCAWTFEIKNQTIVRGTTSGRHCDDTGLQKVINNWTGAPVIEIMNRWGAPTKSLTIAGKEYVVYIDESVITNSGSRYSGGYSYDITDCTWTFEIRRGFIVGGNAVDHREGGCNRHIKKE